MNDWISLVVLSGIIAAIAQSNMTVLGLIVVSLVLLEKCHVI